MKYTHARFAGLIALALAACALFAQYGTTKPFAVPGTNGTWMVMGYALTTSATNIAALTASASVVPPPANTTVFLCGGDLSVASSTSVTATIQDVAGNSFWNAVEPFSGATGGASYNLALGAGASAPIGCRPFVRGMLVSASSGSTITFSGWGVY